MTQHLSTSPSYFLPRNIYHKLFLCPHKSTSSLGLPWEVERSGAKENFESNPSQESWARRQLRVGSWWPPPSGDTQIVNIFRVTQASKGGAIYLDRPGSAGAGEVGVVGAGSCCMMPIPFPAPFPQGNSEFSALIVDFPGTCVSKPSPLSHDLSIRYSWRLTPQFFNFKILGAQTKCWQALSG